MKISILLFGLILMIPQLRSQMLISSQSFENETDSWIYDASPAPFTEPDAIWNILQPSQLPLLSMPDDGNAYWGVKDLYSNYGTSGWGVLSFAAVDLNSYENVALSFSYECLGFDSGDDIKYQLKINGFETPEIVLVDGYNNLNINDSVFIQIPDSAFSLEFSISIKQNGTTDYAGIDRIRLLGNEIIPKPEPSEHALNLHQINASPQSIEIAWEDAEGTNPADYWLVQLSHNDMFSNPTDGAIFPTDNDISDGNLSIKLQSSVLAHQFTGLSHSTSYWIRIIPFSNSGSLSNYKLDETIPLIEVSSFGLSSVFFSEIADPQDNISARFVELFNHSDYNLDFSNQPWYLCKQTNGGSWTCVGLQGIIESMKTFTIASSALEYSNIFTSQPDQTASSVANGNGNDAYALYYGGNSSNGTLVDVYGIIGEDGLGTAWDYTDKQALRKLDVIQANTSFLISEWVIELNTAANCQPDFYGAIFAGTANQYWHQQENWKPGPPPAGANVWIRNSSLYDPVIQYPAALASLKIGHLRNLKGHHLLSLSGPFMAECLIPAWSEDSLGWKLWSAPGTGNLLSNADFTSDGYDLYKYDEQQHLWLNQKNPQHAHLFETLQPGEAYLVAYDTSRIRLFNGNLINESLTISNLSNLNYGWHLIGNPFPAPLIWNTEAWNLNGISPFAYRLDPSGNAYELLFPGDTIHKFEGFWVKAGIHNAELNIPLSSIAADIPQKNAPKNNRICIQLSSPHYEDSKCWVEFSQHASNEYSFLEDALFMSPLHSSYLKFYVLNSDSTRLSLSAQTFDENTPVHLVIEGNLESPYLIKIIHEGTTPRHRPLALRNSLTFETLTPDEAGQFLVQANNNLHLQEFDLYFDSISDDSQLEIDLPVSIGKYSFFQSIRSDEIPQNIKIYNLNGQLIASEIWPEMPDVDHFKMQILLFVLTTNKSQYSRSLLIPKR